MTGMWTEIWIVASFPGSLCRASLVSHLLIQECQLRRGWTCLDRVRQAWGASRTAWLDREQNPVDGLIGGPLSRDLKSKMDQSN